eukprot:146780-Amphidinium_carterae.1
MEATESVAKDPEQNEMKVRVWNGLLRSHSVGFESKSSSALNAWAERSLCRNSLRMVLNIELNEEYTQKAAL